MNYREIRIGNKIIFSEDNTIFEVIGIDKLGLSVVDSIGDETWIEMDQFEGIKITRKILIDSEFSHKIKNFSAPIHDAYENYELDGYEFTFDHFGQLFLCGYNWNTKHMKYVHELQNLFYDLSGDEMDIIIK